MVSSFNFKRVRLTFQELLNRLVPCVSASACHQLPIHHRAMQAFTRYGLYTLYHL